MNQEIAAVYTALFGETAPSGQEVDILARELEALARYTATLRAYPLPDPVVPQRDQAP